MKLGPLKQSIRDGDAPKCVVNHDGIHITWVGQKGPLIVELDRLYPEGKATETGLYINSEGYLSREISSQ